MVETGPAVIGLPSGIPGTVAGALAGGAALAVSISGGKDGQAALALLSAERARNRWPGEFIALHADLGRFEWPETPGAVTAQAARYGAREMIVRRARGDLLQRIEQEAERLRGTGRMVWPGRAARYCTAEMKRDQLVSAQRRMGGVVVSVQGLRAEEGPDRRRKPVLSIERRATTARLCDMGVEDALAARRPDERVVLNWLAVHALGIEGVWEACGTTGADLAARRIEYASGDAGRMAAALLGWPCHAAYVYGSTRVSCATCPLASIADMAVGARHNPWLAAQVARIEEETGQSFTNGLTLAGAVEKAGRMAA